MISGLSSNSEFLHFWLLINKSLYFVSSPFLSFKRKFFEEILSKDFFLNENFNGKIMIDIPKLKKNPLFDKVKLNANFIGQTLDLSKSELLNEKIANLILKKGSLYEDQNNLIFRGNLDFIINNIDKFNNVYSQTRLSNPNDEGYGDMMLQPTQRGNDTRVSLQWNKLLPSFVVRLTNTNCHNSKCCC